VKVTKRPACQVFSMATKLGSYEHGAIHGRVVAYPVNDACRVLGMIWQHSLPAIRVKAKAV